MVALHYKGRIHKAKFSMRAIRYILSDQAAQVIPALQRRWLLPVESRPAGDAASEDLPVSTARIETPLPEALAKLVPPFRQPLETTQHFYTLDDTTVTGWAGAMMKDGVLLALHPGPNWTAQVRAHPHRLRMLPGSRAYFNLMTPIPARGHIFHWLFDSIVPLLTFLESGGRELDLGLIVNAERKSFQQMTVDFIKARYGIEVLEPLGARDAVHVPHLKVAVPEPVDPRALQSPIGMAMLGELGEFLAASVPADGFPKRIYISRNDARLRRVRNEENICSLLEARGFQRVALAGLPIARQVQLFRQAEAVVAPHGAGLAHTAWCQPGTKIIEFFPGLGARKPKNATANMWLIAMQRGLDHRCYLAGPPESRADHFTIPESLLLRALEEASIR